MCCRRGGGWRKGPRWLQGHYLRLPFSRFTVSLTFLGCCFPPFSFPFHDVILFYFGYSLELNFPRGFCSINVHFFFFSRLIRIFILYPAFVTVLFPFHYFFFYWYFFYFSFSFFLHHSLSSSSIYSPLKLFVPLELHFPYYFFHYLYFV